MREIISWELRKLVKTLKNGRCEYCSSNLYLNIHHEDRDATNNDIANLRLLCFWCHLMEHPDNDEMVKWAIRKYGDGILG